MIYIGRRGILYVAFYFVAGCGTATPAANPAVVSRDTSAPAQSRRPTQEGARGVLAEARAKWGQGAPADFSFTVEFLCFCDDEFAEPIRVTVRNRKIVSRLYIESGREVPVGGRVIGFLSMEALFDYIEKSLRVAEEVGVTYNPVLGYPERIAVNLDKASFDDEMGIIISDFVVR